MASQPKKPLLRDEILYPPNLLSMGRVLILLPFILWLAWIPTPRAAAGAALLFVLAGITDFLDGYLARRYQQISILGQFIDPLADKLVVVAVLIELCSLGRVPWWAVALVAARELAVTSLRGIATIEGLVIAASKGGKLKFTLQFIAVTGLLMQYTHTIPIGPMRVAFPFHDFGLWFLYLSLVVSFASAFGYGRGFVQAILDKERS